MDSTKPIAVIPLGATAEIIDRLTPPELQTRSARNEVINLNPVVHRIQIDDQRTIFEVATLLVNEILEHEEAYGSFVIASDIGDAVPLANLIAFGLGHPIKTPVVNATLLGGWSDEDTFSQNQLLRAIAIAATTPYPEVSIFQNDELWRAARCRYGNQDVRDELVSPRKSLRFEATKFDHLGSAGSIGFVPKWQGLPYNFPAESQLLRPHAGYANVAIVLQSPGLDSSFFKFIVDDPAIDGAVFEMLGISARLFAPSRSYSLGKLALEMAAAGKPVVAVSTTPSESGVYEHEISHYRGLVIPGSNMNPITAWAKLSNAISRVDSDPTRQSISVHARLDAIENVVSTPYLGEMFAVRTLEPNSLS
jgi:hypothetical protein